MSGTEKQPPMGVYKCKEMIHDIFLQSGQKDLLMAHIRHTGTQQGWTWTMRDEFIDYIKKKGPDNVNVSHMIADLAPVGRELFPSELRGELLESIFEVTKNYFTIDDTITPITEPDNADSEAEKTFLYQSKDIKPDPGLGVGIEPEDSPPISPPTSPSASPSYSGDYSPGPITVMITSPSPISRGSPAPSTPRDSPGSTPRQSPVSTTPRPLTPQPLPILKPENVTTTKANPIVVTEEEDQEEEEEEDDARNNEDDESDELMDV